MAQPLSDIHAPEPGKEISTVEHPAGPVGNSPSTRQSAFRPYQDGSGVTSTVNGASPSLHKHQPRAPADEQLLSIHTSQDSPLRPTSGGASPDVGGEAVHTPGTGRKNVQFSSENGNGESPIAGPRVLGDEERMEQERPASLYSKLRALAHSRSASAASLGSRPTDTKGHDSILPLRTTNDAGLVATLEEEDSEADADAEESGLDSSVGRLNLRKRRRKFKRSNGIDTEPSSPYSPMNIFGGGQSSRIAESPKPGLSRRATDTDAAPIQSGDESSRQVSGPWTPRHPLRGLSYGGQRKTNEANHDGGGSRRPLTLLTLGNMVSTKGDRPDQSGPDTGTPGISRRKQLAQKGQTLSAAKWRQIKTSLQAFGRGRRKERAKDHEKSAELLAELAAGGPAALMLASMFQRDEHGAKRIPVLLEQLKVSITDSQMLKFKEEGNPQPNDRHIVFRMELEYGSGINRMRWVVRRSLNDFAQLHAKYKLHYQTQRFKGRGSEGKQMPKFPRRFFPSLRVSSIWKNIADEEDDDEQQIPGENAATDPERPPNTRLQSAPTLGHDQRRSSMGSLSGVAGPSSQAVKNQKLAETQRKELEKYLQRMIKFMLFKAEANRLCKFLEVSALGMRLAAEGSYHGKEGYLVIRSAKGLDFRKALTPANFKLRHTPKWFLVRHSYIVCVDTPEAMNIYDVFLFDPEFRLQSSRFRNPDDARRPRSAKDIAEAAKESAKHPQHHRLKITNSERRLKLLARNERMLHQFEESIRVTAEGSPWTKKNRFDSFAPVRPNCFAQWLVDGRDYMWVVSRALNQARDVIYIHDWWLSPELYMRRPPAISQKWRLDRILKRKAEQGVKVFVIVYRNIDAAIPIDSQYTKFSLLDLHPNIFVQRSPNQFRQNTFFWAHHEKLCIVDHTLAFVGGIDLCFGRWDTPQHILTDDKPTGFDINDIPKDADHCQLWPGKDYSNPRIQDFYALNKPYEEMYDRLSVPRMPWHDISMQVIGQPARDLTRHFVQRWNYILRQRKPTRPTPFLLPPPDFNAADLETLGLDGTCEVQLLRSAGPWSLGTPERTEHSIMNAYVKMIEESEHFVYIENQFFISSCETEGATVYNKIGDALVERIIRASKNEEQWHAVVIIPLIPGFQNTVEQEGGTSVRLIMQYQYRSICRGESSIFGRLKAEGIDPEDYIQFYSLRQWGKIGQKQSLVTEQLYIHAKVMIVDDRIALIGSANINERSQLGNRDSEVAAVVRDTDMLWSKMNGKRYRVSRFAHTLRMRLMREHLGLDVDKIMEDSQAMESEHRKRMGEEPGQPPKSPDGDEGADAAPSYLNHQREVREGLLWRSEEQRSFNHDANEQQADNPNLKANRKLTEDPRVTGTEFHKNDVAAGTATDNMDLNQRRGYGKGRDTVTTKRGREVLVTDQDKEGHQTLQSPLARGTHQRLPSYVARKEAPEPPLPPKPTLERRTTEELGLPQVSSLPPLPELDDTDIGGPTLQKYDSRGFTNPHLRLLEEIRKPLVDRDCMVDPIIDDFMEDTWRVVAENNTRIYRAVFRCMPDNEVRDWDEYHQYLAYEQRFNQLQGNDIPLEEKVPQSKEGQVSRTGPPGAGVGGAGAVSHLKPSARVPSDLQQGNNAKAKSAAGSTNKANAEKSEEKDALRTWAAEANRQQMQRTGTDLSLRASEMDEKAALAAIPEDGHLADPRLSAETTTQRAESNESGTTPLNGKSTTTPNEGSNNSLQPPQVRRRRRGTTRSSRRDFNASDDILSLVEAEELLNNVQGHLVEWPYDWLEKVEAGSNWLYPFDQISPIEIYI